MPAAAVLPTSAWTTPRPTDKHRGRRYSSSNNNDGDDDDPVYFVVRPVVYGAIWCFLFFLYCFVALYLLVHAFFYQTAYQKPALAYYLRTFRLMPIDGIPMTITVYEAVAALYALSVLQMLYFSIGYRRLRFGHDDHRKWSKWMTTRQLVRHPSRPLRFRQRLMRCLWRCATLPARTWGVQSASFELATLLREVFEIILQSIQAYTCCRYTSNAILNATFGLLIPLNCFSSPVIHALVKGDLGKQRAIILVVDLFLDIVWLLFPLTLMAIYFMSMMGDDASMYRDTFMARAITELQLIIVTSYDDLIMKIVPALSVWLNIYKMKKLIRCAPDRKTATRRRAPHRIHPNPDVVAKALSRSRSYMCRNRLERVLMVALMLWGSIVTVTYLLSMFVNPACQRGCKLSLSPWFSVGECRCAVQEINCHHWGIRGRESEMALVLGLLNPDGLSSLIITHCPELEIPTQLAAFHKLFTLEIYNSSIISWSPEAHIDISIFPTLGLLYLIRTGISSVPDALLQSNLPQNLGEIAIIGSNLTDLPDSLDTSWPNVRTLYVDHAQLTTFPPVLGRMQLDTVSLCYNHISFISDNALSTSNLNFIALNANPLQRLPQHFGATDMPSEIQVQLTNVSTITPEILLIANRTRLYLFNSTYCLIDRGSVSDLHCASARFNTYRGYRSFAYYTLEGKTAERAFDSPLFKLEPSPFTWI